MIVWCVLLHVKHYKMMARTDIIRMTNKKQTGIQKLVAGKKTEEDLVYEEYRRQLELAIENH